METRASYTAGESNQISKHLRIPRERFEWFAAEAKRQGRSVNAEMNMALEYWQKTRRETMYIPGEKDLNIGAKDVERDRRIIKGYEDKIKYFEAEADDSVGSRRGAYRGHVTKTKRSLDAMSGNLGYHLDWLRRYKPEVYEEVMKKEAGNEKL